MVLPVLGVDGRVVVVSELNVKRVILCELAKRGNKLDG